MMDLLGQIVRDVTLLVLITLFLELILPQGELSGFIRMVMGLLLLAAVLNPVLEYIGKEPSLAVYQEEDYRTETERILEEGEEIALSLEEKAKKQYEEGLSGQIEALVALIEGVEDAEAQVSADSESGTIDRVDLYVVAKDSTGLEDRIKSTLCRFYDLDEDLLKVKIDIREGNPDNG